MQLIIKSTYKDDTSVVTSTTLFSTILWERKYKRKLSRLNEDGLSQEDIAYLAWESLRCDGIKVPDDFELFAKSLKSCLPIEVNSPKADAVLTATD